MCFAGCAEPSSGWLVMLEAVEPCLRTDDEHVLGLLRAVTAPLGPALIRASWFGVEKKLIEHHLNIAHSQAFSEMSTRCFWSSSICR